MGPAVARHRADRPNREPAPAAHRRSHPWFLPVKTEPANDSGARPHPAQNPKPGAPRRAFLPPRAATPTRGPGPPFPATIPAGRRGVAQSGRAPGSGSGGRRFKSCRPDAARPTRPAPTRPARRGPPDAARPTRPARRGPPPRQVPPDRFPQTGSGRRVPADGFWPRGGHGVRLFRTHFFPPFPTRELGGHFGTHPWLKTCIFRRSCRRRFVPAGALFLALAS